MTKPHIVGGLLSPPASSSLTEKSILSALYQDIFTLLGQSGTPRETRTLICSVKGYRPKPVSRWAHINGSAFGCRASPIINPLTIALVRSRSIFVTFLRLAAYFYSRNSCAFSVTVVSGFTRQGCILQATRLKF